MPFNNLKVQQLSVANPLDDVDGTVGAPAFSFSSDTDTGMYRSAANTIGIAANGAAEVLVTTNSITVPAGSVLTYTGRTKVSSSADSVLVATNNAGTVAAALASRRVYTSTSSTPYAAAATESGNVLVSATDNLVFQLPNAGAALAGVTYTFVNTGAAGAAKISISPGASDAIIGTVVGVTSGGVANKDWISVKVTAKQGDYTTLVCDGGTTWYIIGGVGVWASEA